MNIIRIDKSNIDLLKHVDEDIFDGDISLSRLSRFVNESSHIAVIAITNDVVIGQAMAYIHRHLDVPAELYIDNLGVSLDFRRKGIATKLISKLCMLGKNSGCEGIWVATEPDNEEALGFYRAIKLEARLAKVFEGKL